MENKFLGLKTLFFYKLPKGYNIQIILYVFKDKLLLDQSISLNIGYLFNTKINYNTNFLDKMNKFLKQQIII
jgi:hypothetical protein